MLTRRQIRGISVVCAVYSFLLSYYLIGYYEFGDQKGYRQLYQVLKDESFIDGFYLYNSLTGAFEPTYYGLIYLFSGVIEKDLFISVVNSFFGYLLSHLVLSLRSSPLVLPLIAANYYFIVLLFSAERLKFGILFFFAYLLVNNRNAKAYILLMSVSSQFSTALLYVTIYLEKFLLSAARFLIYGVFKFREVVYLIFISAILFAFGVYYSEEILFKFSHYSDIGYGSIIDVLKASVFILFAFMYRKRSFTLISGIPILIGALLFGSDRIVMFSYMYFMYFSLRHNRGLNVGVLLTSTYFGVKGLLFISVFLSHGTGYL